MIVVSVLLGAAATVLLLPTVADIGMLGRWAFGRRDEESDAEVADLPRLLFLVPAHNEELLLGGCLASLDAVDYPREWYDVVVIADNCTDDTAGIARAAGVRCLEREDKVRAGKPWAIAWALKEISIREYDGVVIVDADTDVDPGYATAIAGAVPIREKAVQVFNDVRNPSETALTRMAYVFGVARCIFSFGLKRRAGMNAVLSNGMCLGTEVLRKHGWTAFSICEDWELYTILTELGVPIDFAKDARVGSQEAKSLAQSGSQRRRWAAGKITVLMRYWTRVIRSSKIGLLQKLDTIAELTTPGPVVHLGVVIVLVAGLLLSPVEIPWALWIALALVLSLVRMGIYTLLALRVDPEPGKAILAFAYLPFYTVWRLGVQVLALRMLGDKPWVRTRRHIES